MKRALHTGCFALALMAFGRDAPAHDFNPGVLVLREVEPGRYAIAFSAPVDRTGTPAKAEVEFPSHCRRAAAALDCTPGRLTGRLRVTGLHERTMQVVVSIAPLAAAPSDRLVTGASPELELEPAPGRSFTAWVGLGIEHVLGGLDHLAFVLGLVLIVGRARALVLTVTSFTLAHSFTLALAALDVVRLPPAPVEAAIAASVVLVAREATHAEPTATRNWPWLVALPFGLVHGLGFAGALGELGLPEQGRLGALLGFNLGVELGQLGVVFVALAIGSAFTRVLGEPKPAPRLAVAYALGVAGAYWLIERTVALFTPS